MENGGFFGTSYTGRIVAEEVRNPWNLLDISECCSLGQPEKYGCVDFRRKYDTICVCVCVCV